RAFWGSRRVLHTFSTTSQLGESGSSCSLGTVTQVATQVPAHPAQEPGWAPSPRLGSRLEPAAKRTLDVLVAGALRLLLAPLLLVVALAVRLSSPGPVLFRQLRLGKDGRTFCMLKFRTMRVDADSAIHEAYYRKLVAGDAVSSNGSFKLVDDPRVTRVGRW